MDVDIYEIFNYIKDNSDNKQELADNMNSLIMSTDRSKFSMQLNKLWDEYCTSYGICVCCGTTLETEECKDSETIEYQGFPCKQILYEKYCPNCDK